MRRFTLVAAALSVGLTFAACGGDDDEFTEENLRDELVDADLFDEEGADCVAAYVFDTLSDDEIEEVKGASVTDGDLPPALEEALTNAVAECV
jgi:hypothetical protein